MYAYACAREVRFLDLFTDLYWRLLAVVDTPAWSVGNERLVDLKFYLRCLAKNVGDFPKNVGDFLKNVGDFSENVGVLL